MSRRAAKFTEADVRRALAGARKAGVAVRVEITPTGTITIISGGKPSEATSVAESNPWDEVINNAADKERTT
jgi:hypothetical protein